MKQILSILTLVLFAIACNNSDKTSNKINETAKPSDKTIDPARAALIKELKTIKQALATNDKLKVADLFPFPLADSSFSIYVEDSSYSNEFAQHQNHTTRKMFIDFYDKVSSAIMIDQINLLFHHLNIDNLAQKDTIKYDAYIKSEPCFYSYEIQIEENEVTLRIDMQSNREYQPKKKSQEDIPENSSENCEHNFWWIFKRQQQKLKLTQISGAD